MIPVTIFDVLTIESPLDPRAALATQLAAMPEATREPFLASVSLSLERRHPLGQLMLHSPDPSLTLTTEEQQAYEDATRSLWQHRVVLLKDTNSERALPIWIGPIEAASLAAQLMAQQPLRPLTADLMTTLLRLADLRVEHVTIGELHDQVFYATIKVGTSRQMTEVDCRPSDAINLAALLGVPLYIAEEVMIEAGIVPNSDGRYPISQDSEEQVQYRSLIHER